MNLADLMTQLTDDVDTRLLPTPEDIRRTGDTLRRQRRARFTVGATVLAVMAVVTSVAIVTHPFARSGPEPGGPIDGWRVIRTLEIPGSGDAFYGDSSLWVIDNRNQELTEDGTPSGDLYQIDPRSGVVLDRIPGAVGGWPNVGAGAIWLSTAAGGLNTLTRVDLASHEVTRTSTSHPRQLPHGTAWAAGNLWVANYTSGDLLRMDPETRQVRQTIHLGDNRNGRAPQSLISDGHSVWVGNDNGLITRLDGATGEETSRLQLPIRGVRFDGIDTRRHVLYAHALRGNSIFQINTGPPGPDRIRDELPLTQDVGGMLAGFAVGTESLWAATLNPDDLLRIDPETLRISERIPLTGLNHESNVPIALAASGRAVWIRVNDRVRELAPQP
ncbi:NHL repeat-containing protein [Nocardioides ungokensis]|uniref:hypothetical protein n=1 Tax=Nocardioides ungokensis TaxID=1643322 RepID=UPI0015DF7855|nr:hypothetical protein [Nocardioides ungokensis]